MRTLVSFGVLKFIKNKTKTHYINIVGGGLVFIFDNLKFLYVGVMGLAWLPRRVLGQLLRWAVF